VLYSASEIYESPSFTVEKHPTWQLRELHRLKALGEGTADQARTEVIDENSGPFNQREHRILLQLDIFRNLKFAFQRRRRTEPRLQETTTHGRSRYSRHQCAGKLEIFDTL
jgi:hypothetical protein